MKTALTQQPLQPPTRTLRIGFAGVGWIGKNRMQALHRSGMIEVAAIADPVCDGQLVAAFPKAAVFDQFEPMLLDDLDGIVIATPSALHACQAAEALQRDLPVFCQKPLGRTAEETARVVKTARDRDKLLGVDFSYRHVRAVQEIYKRLHNGEIGNVYAVRVVFHNAYGPDKDWFYQKRLSGGGCVIDLGVHLVDLALWLLNSPAIVRADSQLYSNGRRFDAAAETVEDFACAHLVTDDDAVIDLACSWNLPAGRDAVIEADFIGTRGALALRNVDGSFYDFCAYAYNGSQASIICDGPDDWGGRAAVRWAEQLVRQADYDPAVESVIETATVIDTIYQSS